MMSRKEIAQVSKMTTATAPNMETPKNSAAERADILARYNMTEKEVISHWYGDFIYVAGENNGDGRIFLPILTSPAVALGSIKTEKKAKASRENGKKGGRPKKPAVIEAAD